MMVAQAWTAALILAAPVSAGAEGRLAIAHTPIECVPYDRYPRIAATGAPADEVASAQLQFRAGGEGWYSVGMSMGAGEWSAHLPRPVRPLARLEYRIVMRGRDTGEAETAVMAVRVGDDSSCVTPGQASGALTAPIVVHVPRGAPLVPPVPSGFSPAGVVAAEDRVRVSGLKTAAIGAGLAGGIAAAVAFGGDAISDSPDVDDLPGFRFSRTSPVPGSVLSLSRDQLSVFLLVTGQVRTPFLFDWSFDLMAPGADTVCVSMNGTVTLSVFLPATVTLTGPLNRAGACGEQFDVDRTRLRVMVGGQVVFDATQAPHPFRFAP